MATSSFCKHFSVRPEKANDFVKEMKKPVSPTLDKDFRSNFTHVTQGSELRENILKALGK